MTTGPSTQQASEAHPVQTKPGQEILLFPPEFEMDPADHPNLPKDIVNKAMSASWESVRTMVPHYTHWDRYAALTRLIFISFIADHDGSYVDLISSDVVLGCEIGKLLDTLFGQTAYHDTMSREYRAGVLFMAEKSNIKRRTSSRLFRRYLNSISRLPGAWYYRARGCDMILLFIMYGALASAGYDHDVSFSQQELDIMCEIGIPLYDAVTFYKHRAEGETHNVFAYLDPVHRQETFRRAREVLWALETAWAKSPAHLIATSMIRYAGGPIHVMMRRYRFVEDGLMIGKLETEEAVAKISQKDHMWCRLDANTEEVQADSEDQTARDDAILQQRNRLLFDRLVECFEQETELECKDCRYPKRYGASKVHQFGGVKLCGRCKEEWRVYAESLPERAIQVFPELASTEQGLTMSRRA